jgi:hypothetical protein
LRRAQGQALLLPQFELLVLQQQLLLIQLQRLIGDGDYRRW